MDFNCCYWQLLWAENKTGKSNEYWPQMQHLIYPQFNPHGSIWWKLMSQLRE
jgi:hypothetical protein